MSAAEMVHAWAVLGLACCPCYPPLLHPLNRDHLHLSARPLCRSRSRSRSRSRWAMACKLA